MTRRAPSLTIAFACMALTVLAPGAAPAQDKPLKKVVFAVTTKDISVGHAAHSSLPIALGYWKDEGLDVSVTSVEGSASGLQQLGSGNIQIVSIGPEEIVGKKSRKPQYCTGSTDFRMPSWMLKMTSSARKVT